MDPNFSLSGLASGLNTNSMIQALVAVDSEPKVRLQYQVDSLNAEKSGLTDVETQLQALQLDAQDLTSAASWAPTQTVNSSDTNALGVTRTDGAGPGGYQVQVTQLARAEQRTYTYTAPTAATTMSITASDGTVSTVDIAAGADAQSVADQLNQLSAGPVYAAVVNGSLVLSSRTSGAGGGFTTSSTTLSNEVIKAGQDAQLTVDGTAVTSSTNVVDTAIPGLELTLKAVTSSPVTVTVGSPAVDSDALASKIQTFVDDYNKTIDLINSKISEAKVNNPQNATDAAKGSLHDDQTLEDTLVNLRSTLSETYGSNSSFNLLSQVGISTGATTGSATPDPNAIAGHLTFDKATFTSALADHLSDVQNILGATTGSNGFGQAILNVLDPLLEPGGTIDTREQDIDSNISDYNNQIDDLTSEIALKEQRYREQFANMETALSQAQSQGSWLASQIASLPVTG